MQELKRHAGLLSIIVFLLVIKFALLPIFDWQNTILLDINLQQKKLSKIEGILANTSQDKTFERKLAASSVKSQRVFFNDQEESTFKLEQQKIIEALFIKHKISATNIGWQVTTELQDIAAKNYQLGITIEGLSADIIALMVALEAYPQYINISDFYLTVKGQSAEQTGMMNGRFTLQLYANNKAS
jgi:hypothetical protein